MPEVNIPMLRKAVEWVEEQEKLPTTERQWHQEAYVIRYTTLASKLRCCNLDAPMELQVLPQEVLQRPPSCDTCYCVAGYIAQLSDERYTHTDVVGGVHAADKAIAVLGISPDQGGQLFRAQNRSSTIRRLAEEIAGERL